MQESILKLRRKKCRFSLVINGLKTQEVNLRELQAINNGLVKGVVGLDTIRTVPAPKLFADLHGLLPLSDFLGTCILSKRMFSSILLNILSSVQTAEKLRFNKSLFVFDDKYVLIDPDSLQTQLIYVPLQPYSADGSLKGLLTDIICSAVFDSSEDTSYVSDCLEILNSGIHFSSFALDEYIENNLLTEDHSDRESEDHSASNDENTGRFGNADQGLDYNEESNGLITAFKASPSRGVFLIEEMTGERIPINKPNFRIGKQAEVSDFRIINPVVSRKHAEIVCSDNSYFVVDLFSKNGTFVNGTKIRSDTKVRLRSGDRVVFANAGFRFIIK